MRVALFSRFPAELGAPRGGVETVTLALVAALARRGDLDVHVVTLEPGAGARRREEALGATVHRLPASRWPQALDILGGPGRRRLRECLVDLAPDVVHFHESHALGIGRLPMPSVFTVHGFDHANIPAEGEGLAWLRVPLWRWIERRGLGRQDHVISITPYVRQQIEPLTSACIHDIDNPASPSFFEVPRRPVSGRILTAGWVSHRKNTLGLVEALGAAVRGGLDASLHMAGEARQAAYGELVRASIARQGLQERVRLLGRIGPGALADELAEAEVFALPSRQENAPMAISEALAAGVPVVSSARCGMPFMIDEGETGFLVDPDDTEALAERLSRLLGDGALRARMGHSARRRARERFHPDAVAERTVAVYREIVGGRADPSRR